MENKKIADTALNEIGHDIDSFLGRFRRWEDPYTVEDIEGINVVYGNMLENHAKGRPITRNVEEIRRNKAIVAELLQS